MWTLEEIESKQGLNMYKRYLASKHYPLSLCLNHGTSLVFGSIAPRHLVFKVKVKENMAYMLDLLQVKCLMPVDHNC